MQMFSGLARQRTNISGINSHLSCLKMRWHKIINHKDVTWRDAITILQYFDGVFRAQIFVMSLSVALLAYAKAYRRYVVLGLCAFLIVITMAYSIYSMIQLTRVLRKLDYYSKFNGLYYFLGTTTLFFIGLFIVLGINWEKLFKERKFEMDFTISE